LTLKHQVQRGKRSEVTPEDSNSLAEEIEGHYNISLPKPSSYHQQVIGELLAIGSGVWQVRRQVVSLKRDQWNLDI